MKPKEYKVKGINIADYDYILPDELIAKHPLSTRDECRLLVADGQGNIEDKIFRELPTLLTPDTVMIYNDSKVINARLRFRKGENCDGAQIEIFCLEPYAPAEYVRNFESRGECRWFCFVGNSKRWKSGAELRMQVKVESKIVELKAQREAHLDAGSIVLFTWNDTYITFSQIIEAAGEIPIPPYLNRKSEYTDTSDYQTVYSRMEGSVAAPTAGLHFTENTLKELGERGIATRGVTLHVGAGTFQPVSSNTIGEHMMHLEFFSVGRQLIEELINWKCNPAMRKKVLAVGTTSVRTLESLYYVGCLMHQGRWNGEVPQWYPYLSDLPSLSLEESLLNVLKGFEGDTFSGATKLLIAPGFRFRVVDELITNFHQPSSTLLLLISAFLGSESGDYEHWRQIYAHALDGGYRFLSYGDACLFRPDSQAS